MRFTEWVVRLGKASAVGLLTLAVLSGLVVHAAGAPSAAGAFQAATDYPPPETATETTEGYPYPEDATPTFDQTEVLQTPTEETPTELNTATETATPEPNLFMTEDAQLRDAKVTPALTETFGPTRTATITRTPTHTVTPTITTTPKVTQTKVSTLVSKTLSSTQPPAGKSDPMPWLIIALGVFLPFVLLSFAFLGVALYRESQRRRP